MPQYKVRPGCTLAHEGRVAKGGEVITLKRELGEEAHIAWQVVEVDALGEPVHHNDKNEAAVTDQLETARKHERLSILQAERARVAERLAKLDAAIAAELAPDTPADSKE